MDAPALRDAARRHTLLDQLGGGRCGELVQPRRRRGEAFGGQRQLDRRLAHRHRVRQPHAVGRQHAGQRMDEDARHAQRIGDVAGMLAAGTAEALQRVAGDVVATRHRDALDRPGHVLHRDAAETLGQRFGARRPAAGGLHLGGQRGEARGDAVAVQRLVGLRAEDAREVIRLDAAEHDVGVGHRQRPAAPVAGRARVGAGAGGTDAKPCAVELQQRAAAGSDRVDAHHRRAHAHAGHLGLERALELAGEVADVGAGAAHVEADHLAVAGRLRRAYHADDAARGAGQDRVLALEAVRLGQAAVALHEEEAHARHLQRDAVDVAAQDRRQVGVDDGGITARDELHQRAGLVRDADLGEAGLARQPRRRRLVRAVAPAVQEDDRAGAQPGIVRGPQALAQVVLVERLDDLAVHADALGGLDHALVEQFGQHDAAVEQPRARLVGDAQRVAEAARRHQQRALALALQQRIGRHRGAHLDALDLLRRDRLAGAQSEQAADALDGGVLVLLGVLAQQLERMQLRVGRTADDIGEGATAVDPELPAWGQVDLLHFR